MTTLTELRKLAEAALKEVNAIHKLPALTEALRQIGADHAED